MLFSIVALLATAGLVVAAPPAQSTYCYEDNLLRAFQHTPTPASQYCITATGSPTFLAVTTYPPSRLGSACSCFSRFPADGVAAISTPGCQPTSIFTIVANPTIPVPSLDLLVVVDRTQPCSAGYKIVTFCGTVAGYRITLVPGNYCYLPDGGFNSFVTPVTFTDALGTFVFGDATFEPAFSLYEPSAFSTAYYSADPLLNVVITDVECGSSPPVCPT